MDFYGFYVFTVSNDAALLVSSAQCHFVSFVKCWPHILHLQTFPPSSILPCTKKGSAPGFSEDFRILRRPTSLVKVTAPGIGISPTWRQSCYGDTGRFSSSMF